LKSASHLNAIIRASMIPSAALEDITHITDGAQSVRVVLTRASIPNAGILDMDLPRWVVEPEEASRKNWDKILFVVDVGKIMDMSINVVCKCLVANPRHAIANGLEHGAGGQVKGKINRIDQSQCSTQGVTDYGDMSCTKSRHGSLDRREDRWRSFRLLICEAIMDFYG